MARRPIIDEILAILPADQQAAYRQAHPEIVLRSAKEAELYDLYEPEPESTDPVVAAPAAPVTTAVHTPTLPSAATAPTPAPAENNVILEKLNMLNTSLDAKLADLKKSVFTKDEWKQERTSATAYVLEQQDEMSQIREDHRSEFNERLDWPAFKIFYNAQVAAGVRFLDDPPDTEKGKKGLRKAYDSYVMDRRTQKQIETGVAAGVKQRESQLRVPAQTQSTGMTPAQQVLAKSREGVTGGNKSAAMNAADKLAAIVRARDEGTQVVQ